MHALHSIKDRDTLLIGTSRQDNHRTSTSDRTSASADPIVY